MHLVQVLNKILFQVILVMLALLLNKHSIGQNVFSFDSLLSRKPILKKVNANAEKHRLQIIYTQITRDAQGKAEFKDYTYHVDSSNYFYCASLVKLPSAILALEKTKRLHVYSNTIMFTDSANACQRSVRKDTTSINGYPSIAQYIKRMALVSDNFAYGRVYEFLGVDEIHNRLNELGYKNVRIVHRFDGGCKGTENTTTNPVTFLKSDLTPITSQPQQEASKLYTHPLGDVKVGKAHLNAQNKKIKAPKDFSNMNYISLENIHSMLKRLIFNNDLPSEQRYQMIEDDRQFLIEQLTALPRESSHPTYNKSYHDSYKKYFMYGDSRKQIANTDIKITNIVGQSYGFMVDCAYIQNKKENVEFMLSAVIYANEDEIINDGKYEYNTIALPFLAELGRQIYNY
ncbi:MAG: serine hydrolase, partial [Flavisolibacter sp.]